MTALARNRRIRIRPFACCCALGLGWIVVALLPTPAGAQVLQPRQDIAAPALSDGERALAESVRSPEGPPWMQTLEQSKSGFDIKRSLEKMAAWMVLVLVGCFVGLYLYKQLRGGEMRGLLNKPSTGNRANPVAGLRVVNSVKTGPRSWLKLVRLSDHLYLVGVNSAGVHTIVPADLDGAAAQGIAGAPGQPPFDAQLLESMASAASSTTVTAEGDAP